MCCSFYQVVLEFLLDTFATFFKGLGMNCLENKAGILGMGCVSNSRSELVIPYEQG